MSKAITVEFSDEEYRALDEAARTAGEPPAAVLRRLVRRAAGLATTSSDARAALHAEAEAALDEAAEALGSAAGTQPEKVLADWRSGLPPLRRRAVPAELGPFRGAIRSGDPRSADNDRIDADLAAEFGGQATGNG